LPYNAPFFKDVYPIGKTVKAVVELSKQLVYGFSHELFKLVSLLSGLIITDPPKRAGVKQF
jgi:hypothetical protein